MLISSGLVVLLRSARLCSSSVVPPLTNRMSFPGILAGSLLASSAKTLAAASSCCMESLAGSSVAPAAATSLAVALSIWAVMKLTWVL
uniref:Putative secreted protein n=1 Tax=Ixodes ricinus TaxID=34613 RepID=A0A6B0UAM1_IXORI